MRFLFIDGEKLGVFENGKTTVYESSYIQNYRENARRTEKNRAWKKKTDIMMEEGYYFGEDGERIHAEIRSASFTTEENKIVYVLSVNELSRICYKYLDDKEKTEAHVISSNEVEFTSFTVNQDGDVVGAVRTGEDSSDIVVFSKDGGDYKLVTSGDSLDENPFVDRDGKLLFNSYGIGRGEDNEFITYVPSEIFRYDLQTMEIDAVLTDERYSFVKPMTDSEGNLYCIRKPGAEKKRENIFLQILLIPVRIVEAIIGFISMFVTIFAGKPLVSGKSNGIGGAAKNGKDRRQMFINNQFVNVEQEIKRNRKSEDGGFIPREWKLVKFAPKTDDFESGYELVEELASGVADYCLTEEKGKTAVVYANGQRVIALCKENGKWQKKKLVKTDCCLKVSAFYGKTEEKGPFEEMFTTM